MSDTVPDYEGKIACFELRVDYIHQCFSVRVILFESFWGHDLPKDIDNWCTKIILHFDNIIFGFQKIVN